MCDTACIAEESPLPSCIDSYSLTRHLWKSVDIRSSERDHSRISSFYNISLCYSRSELLQNYLRRRICKLFDLMNSNGTAKWLQKVILLTHKSVSSLETGVARCVLRCCRGGRRRRAGRESRLDNSVTCITIKRALISLLAKSLNLIDPLITRGGGELIIIVVLCS